MHTAMASVQAVTQHVCTWHCAAALKACQEHGRAQASEELDQVCGSQRLRLCVACRGLQGGRRVSSQSTWSPDRWELFGQLEHVRARWADLGAHARVAVKLQQGADQWQGRACLGDGGLRQSGDSPEGSPGLCPSQQPVAGACSGWAESCQGVTASVW